MDDHDNDRLTDVADAMGPPGPDDDPLGMQVGPGTEVGGYVIDGKLGHGGMGVVYSATHPVIGKRAAIKILRPEVSRSAITVERFIQEARAVNQIGHPNIVDIFAYGALPDGRAYHVMDLLVGESLRRRLKRSVVHPSEAASIIDEIASALIAAHDHGFVHRDLKPDNVFLVTHDDRWPEVKLLDFGLAKLMPEHGVAAFTTKAGVMLGTPEYMSPEQARGIGVDHRTDIYALGVVMFEILAGVRPFPAMGDSFATLLQHAEEPPMSLADTVSGLPREMVQLVDAMLAKTPEARPSLAAVRTVIKRLRTTQLPTRSVAGQSMASLSQRPRAPLGITPSRVGAQPVLPGDSRLGQARPLSASTTAAGVGPAPWHEQGAPRTVSPSALHAQQLRSPSALHVQPQPSPSALHAQQQPSPSALHARQRSPSEPQPPSHVQHSQQLPRAAVGSQPIGSIGAPGQSRVQSTLLGAAAPTRRPTEPPPLRYEPAQPGSRATGATGAPGPADPLTGCQRIAPADPLTGSQRLPPTVRGVGVTGPRTAPSAAIQQRRSRAWLWIAGVLVAAAAALAIGLAG